MNNNSDNNSDNKPEIKLLEQGTFGCIFKPGISCNGQIQPNNKFITKIQSSKSTSRREFEIGKLIKTIPNYARYFAPIIDSCEVDISAITGTEIDKCNFIKENKENKENSLKFESNTIKYAGEYTLIGYFQHKRNKLSDKKILQKIDIGHNQLLTALTLLNTNNIVHYDLKQNNIMCKKTGVTTIIDFGLSFNTNDLTVDNYSEYFYVYGPQYVPWCIDIHIISKIVHTDNWVEMKVDMPFITQIIDDFFKNEAVNTLFNDDEQNIWKEIYINYFEKLIGSPGAFAAFIQTSSISAITIINTLIKQSNRWDNYSIAIIYLKILQTFILDSNPIKNKYITLLKGIIMSSPENRPLPQDTILQIKSLNI